MGEKDNIKEVELQDDNGYYVISASDNRGNMYKENQCGSSFSADQDYQDQFLHDIYNPDEHRTKQNFYENFHNSLEITINQYPRFSYLRSFDMCLLSCGDLVLTREKTTPYMIGCFFNDGNNVVIFDGCDSLRVEDVKNLKPYEKFVSLFMPRDRVELYDIIYRRMKDPGFDHKFYFYVFCEYFKIQDHLDFFTSLPSYHQELIEKSYRKRRL